MNYFLIKLVFVFLLVEFSFGGTVIDPTTNQNTSPTGSNNGNKCDYCTVPCSSGQSTGCGASLGNLSKNCTSSAHLCVMTDSMRQYILDQINFNRNIIASGSNPNLTGALHMPKVSYDYELELIATYKLQQCQYTTHDACRNTCDKKYVGQNLGLYGVGINYLSDEDSFKWCSDGWFNEAQYMTNANVKSYYPTSQETAHVTQVVVDGNNKIGCMCLKYEDAPRYFTNWACDFGRGTLVYFPVYEQLNPTQKPGQGCKSGTDKKYTSLCSDAESVVLNAYDGSKFDWASYYAHNPKK